MHGGRKRVKAHHGPLTYRLIPTQPDSAKLNQGPLNGLPIDCAELIGFSPNACQHDIASQTRLEARRAVLRCGCSFPPPGPLWPPCDILKLAYGPSAARPPVLSHGGALR